MLFVHVFHFSWSFLFWLVCVPFGSGSGFCLERNIFVCVCSRNRSSRGAGFVSEKIDFCIRIRTVRLCDPGFCLKPSISVYGPGPFGSGGLFFAWDEFSLVRL